MLTQIDVSSVKGVFTGSDLDAFADPTLVDRVLELTGLFDAARRQLTSPVRVAYIGTAVYDLPAFAAQYGRWFLARGCAVGEVRVADPARPRTVDAAELQFLREAHVVLLAGGNVLFARRRWEESGLDACLGALAVRGIVLAGGAIGWFTAGHSESADPATYAQPMLRAALEGKEERTIRREEEEGGGVGSWSYIRVQGLGLLPGLICPEYDGRGSNGVVRSEDFDKMMKRHPTERGIAIDHWAALVLNGDGTYEVFSLPGKTRVNDNTSTPAVYVKDVVNGQLSTVVVPVNGSVETLLRQPTGPIVRDPFEAYYAMENPTTATEKLIRPPH
ncbi:Peptidase S51 [Trypanosoma melophagium]|uniref:Peptidase S51 n=1 Tax=Trypanosoma melophagium TaxID=715481 RepID=UPI00351A81F6|nr:Peptidase S51 [Trypanosoma melophagium]